MAWILLIDQGFGGGDMTEVFKEEDEVRARQEYEETKARYEKSLVYAGAMLVHGEIAEKWGEFDAYYNNVMR